jgi:hypothetical protein
MHHNQRALEPGHAAHPAALMGESHSRTQLLDAPSISRNVESLRALREIYFSRSIMPATRTPPPREIVAGQKAGREREDATILFWHRGLSLSDIALDCAMLDKAARHWATAALCSMRGSGTDRRGGQSLDPHPPTSPQGRQSYMHQYDNALRASCAGSRVSFRSASPRCTRPGHEDFVRRTSER